MPLQNRNANCENVIRFGFFKKLFFLPFQQKMAYILNAFFECYWSSYAVGSTNYRSSLDKAYLRIERAFQQISLLKVKVPILHVFVSYLERLYQMRSAILQTEVICFNWRATYNFHRKIKPYLKYSQGIFLSLNTPFGELFQNSYCVRNLFLLPVLA